MKGIVVCNSTINAMYGNGLKVQTHGLKRTRCDLRFGCGRINLLMEEALLFDFLKKIGRCHVNTEKLKTKK